MCRVHDFFTDRIRQIYNAAKLLGSRTASTKPDFVSSLMVMVPVFRRFFGFLELVHGQFFCPRPLITHIKVEAVETLNDEMDNNRANYSMAAFVTSEKFLRRWSRLTAYVSVTVNQIGVFLLPLKKVILSFLRQYSLFLDIFFFR